MFTSVYLNELKNILKSPVFYTFLGLLIFFSFQDSSNIVQGRTIYTRFGHAWHNAPIFISQFMAFFSVVGVLFTVVLVGRSVTKDFTYNIHHFFFSSPLAKSSYLFGRFTAGLTANLLIFFGIVIGNLIGWFSIDPKFTGPINPGIFLFPIFVIVLPNIILIASTFFALATLTRSMFYTYMAGVGFIILYFMTSSSLSNSDNDLLKILLDPSAMIYLQDKTALWTITEINQNSVPIDTGLILNRLIWLFVSSLILLFTHLRFKLHSQKESTRKNKSNTVATADILPRSIGRLEEIPKPTLTTSTGFNIKKSFLLAWGYARSVFVNPAFLIITAMALNQAYHNFVVNAGPNGSNVYAFTHFYLNQVANIFAYMIPITIIFGGIIVWRERDHKINELYDSAPLPGWVSYLSKYLALVFIQLFFVVLVLITGVLSQVLIFDFYTIEPLLYVKRLIGIDFVNYLHMAVVVIFIQNLVPNKYVGFLVCAIYYVGSGILVSMLGLSSLINYGFLPAYVYSHITGFGHWVALLIWHRIYWLFFASILMVITSLLWRQNVETSFLHRLRVSSHLLTERVLALTGVLLFFFCGTGFYIYYNSHVVNEYTTSSELLNERAEYERLYKSFESEPHPAISHISLESNFYPHLRSVHLKGHYVLKNETAHQIKQIPFTLTNDRVSKMNVFALSEANVLSVNNPRLGFYVFDLSKAMLPGDSLLLNFDFEFTANGFSENKPKNELAENGSYLYNGSFMSPHFFPYVGYHTFSEISANNVRTSYGLEQKPFIPDLDDSTAKKETPADLITYEATLSTSGDQTAITNGNLVNKWTEEGRNYFRYESHEPMSNALVLTSGRYKLRQDSIDNVSIEVFYDERHEYNIESMILGIKNSLAYCTENFGPYPFKNVRIVEATSNGYPGNGTATSQPTIFTWQEFGGFISNLEDTSSIDVVYNTTTHEMAHQWWGNMIRPAFVEGIGVLSETLSQWVRLKTMEKEYGFDKTQRFLQSEMQSYLRARRGDLQGERPMLRTLNQAYLNYRKGTVVMNSLGAYIGEESVNASLRAIVENFSDKPDAFPTTRDLVRSFRENTPDSLQYLIHDLFETITLHDNRVVTAHYNTSGTNKYLVDLTVQSKKYRSDSLGNETEIEHGDYIPIVIFGKDRTILYSGMHKFTDSTMSFSIPVTAKPETVAIDPFMLLIDRDSSNNHMSVPESSE